MSFIIEFLNFLRLRKKYWLLPMVMIAVIVFVGFVIIDQELIVLPINYIKF